MSSQVDQYEEYKAHDISRMQAAIDLGPGKVCEKLVSMKRHGLVNFDEGVMMRFEGGRLRFFANIPDLFWWGGGDCEEITDDNVDLYIKSCIDLCSVRWYASREHGGALFASRVRGMRPQGAAYPTHKELWPLFDACGPEREKGMGNPYGPGEYPNPYDDDEDRLHYHHVHEARVIAERRLGQAVWLLRRSKDHLPMSALDDSEEVEHDVEAFLDRLDAGEGSNDKA